ncbi:MAG: D-2-hydroxyacid dehydrogenase family protein [Chloroflexi bacterium]|nr:D-2-hydroxyacid dehydrogenase family protein [Chloroflexota bacterium]
MKIVIPDDYQGIFLNSPNLVRLERMGEVAVHTERIRDEDDAIARMQGATIVLGNRERTPLSRHVLSSLPELKLLSMTGTGFANLEIPAATELGILVTRTPGQSVRAVTELTYALLLAVSRRLAFADRAVRGGQWPDIFGRELQEKTLGIIGLGTIGSDVASIAPAFRMKVVAWGPTLTPKRASAAGATYLPLAELLRVSDVVSLHLRSTKETRGILGAAEIAQMKPGSILINTARAALTDEAALISALQEGRMAGAGLDVYMEEPLPPDSPLRRLDNVVLSPHTGWTTEEVFERFVTTAVDNVENYLAGNPTEMLNPEVWQRRKA